MSAELITVEPIALSIESDGLQIETFENLKSAFNGLFDRAEGWRKKAMEMPAITDVNQKREMKLFRESRLALRELRIEVENKRKSLKEDSLRRGKAIDGIANVFKALVVPIEEYLEEQEKFAERAEAKRVLDLTEERFRLISQSGDASIFSNLGTMEDGAFSTLLDNLKLAKEAREEAARKIEQERVEREAAEIAERERQKELERQEAIRIEEERQKREAALKAAKLKAEKELKVAHEKAGKERQEAEAKAKVERERHAAEQKEAEARILKEREEAEVKAAAERKIREEEQSQMAAQASKERAELIEKNRIASEKAKAERAEYEAKLAQAAQVQKAFERKAAQEKAEKEAQAKAEAAARKKAENAPNKTKLTAFAATLENLEIPSLTGDVEEVQTEIACAIHALIALVKKNASKL